jgi:hypothetical protein
MNAIQEQGFRLYGGLLERDKVYLV